MVDNYKENALVESTNINYLIQRLLPFKSNNICADCMSSDANWTNTAFGVFLCSICAVVHKNNFTKLNSYIKSIDIGLFNYNEYLILKNYGNSKLNRYLNYYGIKSKLVNIKEKYCYKAVLCYFNLINNINEFKESSLISSLNEALLKIELTDFNIDECNNSCNISNFDYSNNQSKLKISNNNNNNNSKINKIDISLHTS